MGQLRQLKQPLAVTALAVLGASFGLLASSATAAAQYTCPGATHCYSVALLNDGVATTGIFGTWQNSRLTPDLNTANGHFNSTIWLATNLNAGNWVEVGLIQYSNGTPPPYCCGYVVYWSDYTNNSEVSYNVAMGQTADGSSHNYEIQRASTQNWFNIYRDYSFIGVSNSQSAWSSCPQTGCNQAGGELGLNVECPGPRGPGCDSDLDTNESTGNFDVYMQSKNPSGAWYYWSNVTYATDAPCGPNPVGYCFNGYPYYTYEWSWNKGS